jgi:hypothetical protein
VRESSCVPLAVVFVDIFAIKRVEILLDIIFLRGSVHTGATWGKQLVQGRVVGKEVPRTLLSDALLHSLTSPHDVYAFSL